MLIKSNQTVVYCQESCYDFIQIEDIHEPNNEMSYCSFHEVEPVLHNHYIRLIITCNTY